MNKIVALLTGLVLFACTEISYKEPQPKGIKPLTSIPAKFHGTYLLDDKDTVVFFDKGLRGKDKGKEEVLYLSDSIVLKEYKNRYFISYRDGNVWLLRILTRKKNGDLFLSAMEYVPPVKENDTADVSQRKIFIEKLSKEIPVIESNSHYIIEPSPKKLNKLIKKGFFKEQEKAWMKKIN